VHNLFLIYLSICTWFGGLWVHHQEKQLCLCDTWYLLFCVDDCLLCRSITVFMRHLVFVILCGWLSGMQEQNCVHATHVACYSVWMTVWYAGA